MPYVILIALLFVPNAALAATLTLIADPPDIGVGDLVRVTIAVRSDVPVNAFSGALRYPSAVEPVEQEDGNSIISLWVEQPAVEDDSIRFAGIVPGGYSGEGGELFAATF